MNEKRRNLKPHVIAISISVIVEIVIFCLFFFIKGIGLISAIDGCAVGALVLLASGGLIFVSRNGFFDIFSYGFKQLGSQIFSKNPNQHNDFPAYKEAKNKSREKSSKYYISVLFVGLFFLIFALILWIIFRFSI